MAILYSAKRYTGIEESGAITGSGGGASVTIADTAPNSPTAGDLWFNSASLKTFVYYNDGSSSQWLPSNPVGLRGPTGNAGLTVQTSDTAPSNPSNGDVWFDTSVAKTFIYYTDSDSSQWIQMNPSTSITSSAANVVTQYSNVSSFSSSNNAIGDFAFAQDTKALYMWDGTEWDRIYSGPNETPTWTTEPNSTYDLNFDGTASTIITSATDPEGFPITYTYDTNPSNQSQATIVNNNDGSFTFTPSTTLADAGTFTTRFKASDGVHVSTKSSTFTLAFKPETIEYLLVGGGGGGGWSRGGGGGAGGVLGSSSYSITGTSISVSVGAGGSGGIGGANQTNGGDTTLDSVTAVGGGKGASSNSVNGGNGGSGGGAVSNGTAGTGTAGQGNPGGVGNGSLRGGGGGGAGGAGQSHNQGAAGGAGVSNSITGVAVTYAGGGGGGVQDGSGSPGAGGSGGGGAGGGNPGSNGTDGLGGGGGGGGRGNGEYNGGNGGSGVVIIAYPEASGAAPVFDQALTYTEITTRAGYRVYKITAGTGNISWG